MRLTAHLVGSHIQVHLNRADADATPTSEVEKNDSPKLLFAIICNNFKNYAFVFENKINWLNFIYIQPEVFHQTHQNSVHQRWIDRDTVKIQAKKLELYLVETKRREKSEESSKMTNCVRLPCYFHSFVKSNLFVALSLSVSSFPFHVNIFHLTSIHYLTSTEIGQNSCLFHFFYRHFFVEIVYTKWRCCSNSVELFVQRWNCALFVYWCNIRFNIILRHQNTEWKLIKLITLHQQQLCILYDGRSQVRCIFMWWWYSSASVM